MRIVCDQHIPFLVETVRRGWPEVAICPMKPEEIDARCVRDADALVVRTRTRVEESLLAGSSVRLVCSATIGYDHIDTAYCEQQGVRWATAPGCNAQAVCDYIEETLDELVPTAQALTIGVVGVGHVGTLVAAMAERKGLRVLLNDPPKGIGVPLDEIAQQCDVITFHTPLTTTGEYPTYHLCDDAFLARCRRDALIINAARGGVVDEEALLRSSQGFVLDTWEGEPHLRRDVLMRAERASMHIAGYSMAGKRNATQACLDAIARRFELPQLVVPAVAAQGDTNHGWLERITQQLKERPEQFESLRANYALR